jgi:hypothetical protein
LQPNHIEILGWFPYISILSPRQKMEKFGRHGMMAMPKLSSLAWMELLSSFEDRQFEQSHK